MDIQTVEKPWGSFTRFTHNEDSTVKILVVNPGQELSLQHHEHRSEFWKVLSGTPLITIGEVKTEAVKGDEFFIQEKVSHRISADDEVAEILEISFGTFDENDIIRTEDKYGRV